jgi:hypothetical protein
MAGTDLCDKTLNTIRGLLLLLGEGVPNPGDVLKTASSRFQEVESKLTDAFPGLDWVGEAADKYSAQNLAQQLRMKTMSNLDTLTGGFVSNQAGYIQNTRNVLNAMKTMVEGARKACAACEKVPIIGDALSYVIAGPACALAMAVVGGAMLYLTIMTMTNLTNLQGILPRLIDMLTTLPKLSDFLPGLPDIKFPEITWPPDFSLPDIKWPDIQLPDFQWPDLPGLPGLPDIKLPDLEGLFPNFPDIKFPDLSDLPKLPDLFPGLPSLPDIFPGIGGIPKLPVIGELQNLPDFLGGIKGVPTLNFQELVGLANMPTMNQLSATLQQLTQLTSGAGGAQMLSSLGGQTSSFTSLASSGGGGAQSAALVSDTQKDDDAGAGAGATGGERAPVAATGGSTDDPQQGRVL